MGDMEEKSKDEDGNQVARVTFLLTMILAAGFVGTIFVFVLR
jgi:hypothetical protein